MKRLIAILAAISLFAAPFGAWAQKTKSTLSTEIGVNFPTQTTGQITPALASTTFNDFVNSWQQFPAVNAQVGTSYSLQVTDYGQLVTLNNSGAIAVALPQATGSFATWNAYVSNIGTGTATITPSTSTICGASSLALTQNQGVWIVSDGANYQCAKGTFGSFLSATAPLTISANTISISPNGIGYTLEAQAISNTVVGNPTNATANKQDMAMPSCSSVSCALQWLSGTGFQSGTVVGNFNGRSGSISPTTGDYTLNQLYNCTVPPQGRLTNLTGTPVPIVSTTAAVTMYYTPYVGQQVPLYDGTRFTCVDTGGELFQGTTDTTKSPAAVASNSCYDVFVWSDSGTIRATRGPLWTNTTTRSAGTALTRQNGIYLNNATITNGPAASRGTYVGTFCSNGSSQVDFIFGNSASGGTAGAFNIWNQYNRVDFVSTVIDTGALYTQTGGIRQCRGSAGMQNTVVSGNPEDGLESILTFTTNMAPTNGKTAPKGFGLDTTGAFTGGQWNFTLNSATSQTYSSSISELFQAQTGRHVISCNENETGVGASTFDGNANDSLMLKFRM